MQETFPPLADLTSYPHLTIAEFVEHFPGVEEREIKESSEGYYANEDDLGTFQARWQNQTIVFVNGDVYISQAQVKSLREQYFHLLLAIDGHVQFENDVAGIFYVSGDLLCKEISLSYEWLHAPVGGKIIADNCALLYAEDDESTHHAPFVTLETPLLFSWFYSLENLQLDPQTTIFILADWDYCNDLALPNPLFIWHQCVYVLKDEFVNVADFESIDSFVWKEPRITSALAAGQSIFRDGFSLSCMPQLRAADDALRMRQYDQAYSHYKNATQISPSSYFAWYGMGEALFEVGAYEQAFDAYHVASKLFPAKQTGLVNEALNNAALCAILLGRLASAIDLATQSIQHTRENVYDRDRLASAYLFRAEAHLLSGRDEAAQSDLERAHDFDSKLGKVRWLFGLLFFRQGNAQLAEEWRQKAIKQHQRFSENYTDMQSTAFLHKPASRVDWDKSSAPTTQEKDQAYWLKFMRSNVPEALKRVPVEFRSPQLCMEVLLACGPGPSVEFVRYFPENAFSREMAENLMRRSPWNLKFIPLALRDYSLCTLPSADNTGFDISLVPPNFIDYALCLHAVKYGEKVDMLPNSLVDKALCLAAIEHSCYNIQHIPTDFLEDDLYFAAIARASSYFFDSNIAARYKTPLMLQRAIDFDKRALDTINGHLFDTSLFVHAEKKYGQDADWPEIVARHSPAHCLANPKLACAEACWQVFWDEAFMLLQINKPDNALRSWKIPRHLYTQAVAQAVFEHDRIHLNYIPAQFVTSEMVSAFVRSYPDKLSDIPPAMRTKNICENAVKKNAENFKFVPLEWRSKEMCIHATREDKNLIDEVPNMLVIDVVDHLLQHHHDQFDFYWLYLCRGDGEMARMPANIPQALSDYERAIAALKNSEDEDLHQLAAYYKGYCHFLCGDTALSQEWYAMSGSEWTWYGDFDFDDPKVGQVFEIEQFELAVASMEDQFRVGDSVAARKSAQQAQQFLADALMEDGPEAEKLQERVAELGLDES